MRNYHFARQCLGLILVTVGMVMMGTPIVGDEFFDYGKNWRVFHNPMFPIGGILALVLGAHECITTRKEGESDRTFRTAIQASSAAGAIAGFALIFGPAFRQFVCGIPLESTSWGMLCSFFGTVGVVMGVLGFLSCGPRPELPPETKA